jgi:hypothetical protein
VLGRGIRLALAATLVVTQWFVSGAINDARAAGTPAAGYAVTDFATGFSTFLFYGPGPIGVAFDAQGNLYSTAYLSGGLYRFPPAGGTFETSLISSVGFRVTGLAFDKAGRLFVARQGEGDVLELDPATGAVKATVASGICSPNAVVVDPLSGDLFVSSCGTVLRLSGYQGSPVTPTLYTANVSVDGLTFAPDGTLYGASGAVYRITGTSDSAPGTASVIAAVPAADGVALVAPANGSQITQLAVNRNDGIITLVDFSVQPVTYTDIVTGGSRGDFVGVGPDKCLYATQSDEIEKVTAADGSCPFLPTGVSHQTTSCNSAGQMVNSSHKDYHGWSFDYGVSVCEGLVVSNVSLEGRLMAERMSVPYLDLVTCSSSTDIAHCTNTTTRHLTLQPDAIESPSPAAYTRVRVTQISPPSEMQSPQADPCGGDPACAHEIVAATYIVDLAPAPAVGLPTTWLSITQRYEFYRPFKEKDVQAVACEPSQYAPFPIGLVVKPLPDCGRWKPIVFYHFQDDSGSTLLVSLNAAARLHYTPDALAVRAGMLARDCDASAPKDNCDPTGHLDVYPPTGGGQPAIQNEVAVRGVSAALGSSPTQPANLAGRYDNVHQTPTSSVEGPVPVPPGCPECVHMHWRWGSNLGAPSFFGDGQPLIGDGIPAAIPNPLSHQGVDVALVSYHSEELSPYNYLDLVSQANTAALNVSIDSNNHYHGGYIAGTESLRYPPASCAKLDDLTSWGQCGEVVWLSATSYTNVKHDEDQDTFFAFGGFFCGKCVGSEYARDIAGLTPTYKENQHPSKSRTFAIGSKMTISFTGLVGGKQVNDVLPPGLTGVTATYVVTDLKGHPLAGPADCTIGLDAKGRQVATCDLRIMSDVRFEITIIGTFSNASPGSYSNTVHAIWGTTSLSDTIGGNYKKSDSITIV